MVERTDRALFRRIQGHVADGRWEIVNGWWVQPDCNLLGVVCPDVYALDATPVRTRFTLLRAPYMARHQPQGAFPAAVVADQGPHRFRFRFFLKPPTMETLATHAVALLRPPLTAELTRGMKARWTEYRSATNILQ